MISINPLWIWFLRWLDPPSTLFPPILLTVPATFPPTLIHLFNVASTWKSLTCLMHGEVSLNGWRKNAHLEQDGRARLLWLLQIWGFYICGVFCGRVQKKLASEAADNSSKTSFKSLIYSWIKPCLLFSLLPQLSFKSLFLYLNILLLLFLLPLSLCELVRWTWLNNN